MKTPSCINKKPFVELEDNGQASVLNYNLPQSTCYNIYRPLVLDLPTNFFKPLESPRDDFWFLAKSLTKEQWIENLNDELNGASDKSIFNNPEFLLAEKNKQTATKNIESLEVFKEAQQIDVLKVKHQQISYQPRIANESINDIADKIKKGYRPFLAKNIVGKSYIKYVKRPKTFKPEIAINLKLKMCSYLGDYGAGKTVKTFSLLPGERTSITIRTYEHLEETKKETSNVLDSVSDSVANEFQDSLNSESSQSSTSDSSNSHEFTGEIEASGKIPVINVGVNASASTSDSSSFNSAVSDSSSIAVNATSSQVSKSDSLRKIEVNTETSSTSINETEQTIVRELENINKSRVLNFVFRQLQQEYFTITYIDNVSFAFADGYSEHTNKANLENLDGFLSKHIITDKIDFVKGQIIKRLCSIYDYTGTKVNFIECIEEELSCDIECDCLPEMEDETICYFRKRKDLTQTYKGKSVNGIILDVTHRIIRTPALVVDALLGQGEALDCFNQHLQNESVREAKLENDKLKQSIDIIDDLSTADKQAKLYKKVFGDCCDVAQSGGHCDCNNNQNP